MKNKRKCNNKISKRILALISWIKPNSFVIDVGTDHAYLPIALIDNKITDRILAIDNNIKPLARARSNILDAGYTGFIELKINDGLNGLNFSGDEIIVIAGMGGVLISKILDEAKSRFKPNQTFILQPNWTWYELRKWLADNGFKIEQEQIINEQNKFYSQLCVKYTGEEYAISDTEAFCGINIKINTDYDSFSNSEINKPLNTTSTAVTTYLAYLNRLKQLAERKSQGIELYQLIKQEIEDMISKQISELKE